MSGLDLALVLPGAASLGAYQAGAVAAILEGRNLLTSQGAEIDIPAIGGASAGATVALLAAHSMAHSIDPVELLTESWVDGVDFELLASGSDAPLGLGELRERLATIIRRTARPSNADVVGRSDVQLHIALTSLRGYHYLLEDLGSEAVSAVTYADWVHLTYRAGADPDEIVEPKGRSLVDFVLASAANPIIFPPVMLNRGEAADDFRTRGFSEVADGPDHWWFTDGGMAQSRPVQSTLDLVPDSDRPVRAVVIDPRSEGPTAGSEWAGPSPNLGWLSALERAMSIFPAQVISDELRRLDEANRTLELLAKLAEVLQVSDEKRFRELVAHDEGADVLSALISVAGLPSERPISADVIHPRLVESDVGVEGLLAGELLGDFAGFLRHEMRQSDFALGYAAARQWWQGVLPDHDMGSMAELVDDRLAQTGPPPWQDVHAGTLTFGELPAGAKLDLARVVLRSVRAALKG